MYIVGGGKNLTFRQRSLMQDVSAIGRLADDISSHKVLSSSLLVIYVCVRESAI